MANFEPLQSQIDKLKKRVHDLQLKQEALTAKGDHLAAHAMRYLEERFVERCAKDEALDVLVDVYANVKSDEIMNRIERLMVKLGRWCPQCMGTLVGGHCVRCEQRGL